MGLSLDPRLSVPSVEASSDVGTQRPVHRPQIGWGPTSAPTQSRSRSAGAVFGAWRPAVAAVLLGALGLVSTAQAQVQAQPLKIADGPLVTQAAPLARGFQRLLAADANQDGKIIDARYQGELDQADPLAKAIFAYANYVNPSASFSPWGLSARGDYLEGGLGQGYTLRPKHMTAHGFLQKADLEAIWGPLQLRLGEPLGSGLPAEDLKAILDQAPAGTTLADVHQAAEALLITIQKETGQKELRIGSDTAILTQAELTALLPAGSLARTIAETTAGHGLRFFARELQFNPNLDRVAARGYDHVGDAQQQYLLTIAKRAKEAALLGEIQALL